MHSELPQITLNSTYRAAYEVAKTIERHFVLLHQDSDETGGLGHAHLPEAHIIEAAIDAAFWSSLRREEGQSPKISIALLPSHQAGKHLLFAARIPLTVEALTKLAAGVERPGIYLGVWHENDQLFIWGTTREIPIHCFVLDVSEPGLMVIKHRQLTGFGKFVNVAVLIGDQVKVIDENSANIPDCPTLIISLLGISTPSSWNDSINVLVQLAVSMRAHGRGGSLLIVPSESEEWRESIMHPLKYAVVPYFTGLADLINEDAEEKKRPRWRDALQREVDSLAGLTAIDGTTIINDKYELIAFGAKIQRAEGKAQVEQIIMTEPVVGSKAEIANPGLVGGTRHISAAQFVHDQRNALALVASQDGRFTVFAWSPCEGMVHAHSIGTLLL